MAKITNYIPEPKEEYDVDNQRQILESIDYSETDNLIFHFKRLERTNKIHIITFYHDHTI